MSSQSRTKFTINGKIDTSASVFDNLSNVAANAQSFITWDASKGKWRVIINREGETAVMSFNDDNIIGAINVSGSGISELYNAVKAGFANKELNGDTDEAYFEVIQSERFANETDNTLNLDFDLLNDVIQVKRLAQIELNQSRIDKIIEFVTDFRAITLQAGDVIDVTNSVYDFVNKKFRILAVEEVEDDQGGILVSITALEYDDLVYSEENLTDPQRDKRISIVPAKTNTTVVQSKSEDISNKVGDSLNTQSGINNLTKSVDYGTAEFGVPLFQTESIGFGASAVANCYANGTSGPSSALQFQIDTYRSIKNCVILFEAPQGDIILNVEGTDRLYTQLGIPTTVQVFTRPFDTVAQQGIGSFVPITVRYMEWSSYFTAINVNTTQPSQILVQATPLNTYDLSAIPALTPLKQAGNFIPNAKGEYATLTILAFLG